VRYLCAMQGQQGGEGGAGAGEEERRRDEGTGERVKEVVRTVGGKATGAWVISQEDETEGGIICRGYSTEDGCDRKALRCVLYRVSRGC
jgi:hypothetical protein